MKSYSRESFERCQHAAQEFFAMGEYELAEDRYQAALKSAELKFGESSAAVGIILLELADFYEQLSMYDDARTLLKRATHIMMKYYARFVAEHCMEE